MKFAGNSRESLAVGVSLLLGLTVAAVLKMSFMAPAHAPTTAKGSTDAKPTAVRVRAKAAPAPALVAVPKAIAAPVRPKMLPVVREVAVQASNAPTTRSLREIAPPPQIDIAPSVALVQPELVVQPPSSLPDVPPLPASTLSSVANPVVPPELTESALNLGDPLGRPNAPPDDYVPPPRTFVEQQGGEVLVLGLLLDSTGRPLDVQIFVGSYDSRADLAYAAAVLNNDRFTAIDPPIGPGETRWIETRIYYPKRNILP